MIFIKELQCRLSVDNINTIISFLKLYFPNRDYISVKLSQFCEHGHKNVVGGDSCLSILPLQTQVYII